jgi:hypothetical protein
MRYPKLILGALLATMLAACAPAAPSPIPETSTPENLPPTRTTIPTPTWTRVPSYTPTPTLTKSQTFTPTLSNTPVNNPKPTATEGQYVSDPYWAPNNEYSAKLYFTSYHPPKAAKIEISDTNGIVLWTVTDPRGEIIGDPHPNLAIYKWSEDSSLLYFYYSFSYDGVETLWNGLDLQSIDIKTGQIKRVLPGEGLMAFAFSLDGSFIAYVRQQDQPRRLFIRNLSTGAEKNVVIDLPAENEGTHTQAGWIDWSPDGHEILYYTFLLSPTERNEIYQAVHLDISTMKQRVLLEFFEGDYVFAGWTPNGSVRFLRYSYPKNEVVEINVKTGKMTTIGTVTPTP